MSQFNTAVNSAKPGDTITLSNGTWQNADLLFKGSGTSGSPITVRAQNAGHVILSGSSRLRIAGRDLVVDGLRFQNGSYTASDVIQFRESSSSLATNCVLQNCAIVDYNPADTGVDNKWVSIYGVSNRVENCYFKGKLNSGTTLVVWPLTSTPNYHVIRANYFGPRSDFGANGAETIRVGTSDVSMSNSRTTVEANYFYKCNGEIEVISSKTGENVYRHNTFDSCEGALTLRHGNRNEVYGNFFLGRGLPLTGGVRIIGEDHRVFNNYFSNLRGSGGRSAMTLSMGVTNSPLNGYFQVKNAAVTFNTFVNCAVNFLVGNPATVGSTNADQPPIDCVFANNLVLGTNSPLIDQRTAPINMLYEGNIMNGATLGIPPNGGISTANPQLVMAPDGLWRPGSSSPAIGSAAGLYPYVDVDMDGHSRPASKDVGADQRSLEAPVRRPLEPSDAGPEWMRAAGEIRSIGSTGGNVIVTWDSLPGLFYQVYIGSDLTNWTAASPVIPSGGTTTQWTDNGSHAGGTPAGVGQRYYRIALVP